MDDSNVYPPELILAGAGGILADSHDLLEIFPDEPDATATLMDVPCFILQDDKNLFEGYNQFLSGKLDQKTFQANYCVRLLFIWEWVYYFCFRNYASALQTWYQILEQEDIWLWVDGDERIGPEWRLIMADNTHKGSTDLHSVCVLSRNDLQGAVEVLKKRQHALSRSASQCVDHPMFTSSLSDHNGSQVSVQHTDDSSWGFPLRDDYACAFSDDVQVRGAPQFGEASYTSGMWRQRLNDCSNAHVRYLAVVWSIATSSSIRALDYGRQIPGRSVSELGADFEEQLQQFEQDDIPTSQAARWEAYLQALISSGHSCILDADYKSTPTYGLHLTFELIECLDPQYIVQAPVFVNKTCYSCLHCIGKRSLFVADIPWRRQPSLESIASPSPVAPRYLLRYLWWLWLMWVQANELQIDVRAWLHWLELLVRHEKPVTSRSGNERTSILYHLLSAQMEEWIRGSGLPEESNQPCFRTEEMSVASPYMLCSQWNCLYTPTVGDWMTAEDILRRFTVPTDSGTVQKPFSVHAILGILMYWISTSTVITHFPDIKTFYDIFYVFGDEIDLGSEGYSDELLGLARRLDDPALIRVRTRILEDQPSCCHGLEAENEFLKWHLSSALLLLPEELITKRSVWNCRCHRIYCEDIPRIFESCLANERMLDEWKGSRVQRLLKDLAEIAKKYDVDVNISFENGQSSSGRNQDKAEQASNVSSMSQGSTLSTHRSNPEAAATTHIPPYQSTTIKASRSSHVAAIRGYIINLLKTLEAVTGQIPALVPRGNQKIGLPWMTLTQILDERGYELENWPVEVPLPGSGSMVCDDNKGIQGLSAIHLRALYNATQRQDQPLQFRPKAGVSVPENRPNFLATHRTVRRREEVLESEDVGPNKRRRIELTGSDSEQHD